MPLDRALRGPMPHRDAPIQILPSAQEIAGKEVTFEANAPERADWRVLLGKLHSGEEGLVKRYIEEAETRKEGNRNYYMALFEREFDENPQDILERHLSKKDREELQTEVQSLIEMCKQLNQVVATEDEAAMRDFQRQFSQFGTRNANLGADVERELAGLIKAVTEEKKAINETKKKAMAVIGQLYEEQMNVKKDLLEGITTVRYENLSPHTQAWLKQWYFRHRWDFEEGTIKRNAELRVLTTYRPKAPHMVMDGRERHIYPAIVAWRELNDELSATDDPIKRDEIKAKMKTMEDTVQHWSSALTGTFDERFELGPTAVPQIRHGAWDEIQGTIDRLRDENGNIQKAVVITSATYDQGSWEAMGMKSNIFFQFGVARNALKHLNELGVEGLGRFIGRHLEDLGFDQPKNNMVEIRHAERALREAEEKKNALDASHLEQQNAYNRAERDEQDSEQEITNLRNFIQANNLQPLPGGGGGNRGNNQRNTNHDSYQLLANAMSRRLNAHNAVEDARAKIDAISLEIIKANEEKDQATRRLSELKYKEKAFAPQKRELQAGNVVPIDTEQKYDSLTKKLQQYIEQESLEKDFYELFSQDEIRLIAKLGGVEAHQNARTKKYSLSARLVNSGDDQTDGFESDYAFIDLSAIGHQKGRSSPTALEDVLNNPGRYPELAELIAKLQKKDNNKVLLVLNSPPRNDVDGGMIENEIFNVGRLFNNEEALALKSENNWKDADLFNHWLDDLEVQARLGVRPEEIEARYTAWMARQHQLRNNFFSADNGWTFLNTNIASSTTTFFETTIRRMVDANLQLTSTDYRKLKFNKTLGRTNEYAVTITDKNLNLRVLYRNMELNASPEAPKTRAARLYRSIANMLALYHQRSQIGGQSIVNGEHLDPDEMGAFIMANLNLIEAKTMRLQAIYDDPTLQPEERIEKMLDFYENELTHLSYDLLDENGEFVTEAANPELWEYYNDTSQWLGKLKRNQREAEERYSYTLMNRNATQEEIDLAEVNYAEHLGERRNFEVKQHLLGLQATGQLKERSAKEIGQIIAKRHSSIGSDALMRIQEHSMRAYFGYDDDEDAYSVFNVTNVARRLVGKLAKNRIADLARAVGRRMGIGDRFLREVDQSIVSAQIRKKMDTQIIKRAAAHISLNVQTGYQNSWRGIFAPSRSTLLYDNDNTGGILDTPGGPGVDMSPTARRYMSALERRVGEDIGDAIDRILRNNMHVMVKAASKRGWNIDQMMKTYLDAGMNDKQVVENGYYNMYGKSATNISMLEYGFLQELRARTRGARPNGPTGLPQNRAVAGWRGTRPQASLPDTRYGPLVQSPRPMISQHPDYQ